MKLFRLNGIYEGFIYPDVQTQTDRIYRVKYSFWGLFRFSNLLLIEQISDADKGGNWISKIPINANNPLIASGNYQYLTKSKDEWGVHSVVLNLDQKIIHITAEGKHSEAVNKYFIKKK